ncbi:hypothetical protein [Alteribacter populi]|uniref:hypothetical protein n=1 Tax=Alteribacter populi TaxID=2011011 RepID=UPI000BBA53B2|nr:hypothetical protein [Alteribacter populi]
MKRNSTKITTVDFREFVRNERIPKPVPQDYTLASVSIIDVGSFIIVGAGLLGLGVAAAEMVAARRDNEHVAEGIVKFMRLFMPITLLIALIVLTFFNPLIK